MTDAVQVNVSDDSETPSMLQGPRSRRRHLLQGRRGWEEMISRLACKC